MTKRFILGKHPLDGSYGIWLSKLGVDATTTIDVSNFLIAPGAKNQMILMSGFSGAGTVLFPYTLSSKPYVYFKATTNNGVDTYPFDATRLTNSGDTYCSISTTGMTFIDTTGLGLVFRYLVINGSIPG